MSLQINDKDLVLKIRTDHKSAFDALFQKYYVTLCRFALSFLRCEDLAEDAVQRTFIQFWERRKSIQVKESVKAYLFKSTYNECLRIRKQNIKRISVEEEFVLLSEASINESEQEQWRNIRPILQNAIQKLPLKCRDIFILRRQEGLTNQEIAEYLGISVKTVENQMTIAINKLKIELKPFLKHIPLLIVLLEL